MTPSDDDDDDDAGGGDELLRIDDEETLEEETSPDDAVGDVFVRFTLSVAGLPAGANGALEAAVTVVPVGRFSYEIVWYELSVTYPTFYSHQVDVVVQEGHDAGKPEEEIEQDVEDLVEGSATFFRARTSSRGAVLRRGGDIGVIDGGDATGSRKNFFNRELT